MAGSKHFLHVGSLLRPEELQEYNEKIKKRDDITYPFYNDLDGYFETEEKVVKQVVDK